jgi:penicillin-binding protein 1A
MDNTEDISENIENRTFKKVFKYMAIGFGCVIVIMVISIFVFVRNATKDMPSIESLAKYKPPVMSRVHAGDGKLISEFRTEARVFVPIASIPKQLQYAFVAAEDKRFYSHNGFDEKGFLRAMWANISHVLNNERLEGGSTITQQVAKNFLVGNERNITRKIREIVIAGLIEEALSKDLILELYLNDIYFGRGAYGVAAASLNYFGKPMKDLSLNEIAYLAVLPKAPNNYQVTNPTKKAKALSRRNYVLTRMLEDGYADESNVSDAKESDIVVVNRFVGDEYLASEYFVEEARKQIKGMYGNEELYGGGLSIRTTLDTRLQLAARKALRKGLENIDMRHGYRGPLGNFNNFEDWRERLSKFDKPADIGDWQLALVMEVNNKFAKIGFAEKSTLIADNNDLENKPDTLRIIDLDGVSWAKRALEKGSVGRAPKKVSDVLNLGDIVLVQRKLPSRKINSKQTEELYNLRQVPKVNGGLIAMDPNNGRVLALVGGYSFQQSQFNRATQAKRQPGSALKPFVYAAALDNGYTPASQVLDAPFVIERKDTDCVENRLGTLELLEEDEDGKKTSKKDNKNLAKEDQCERFYKPSNYNAGKFYGLSTLRLGLEKSRNAMTVRLANEIGMVPINKYIKRFGLYEETKPELAWSLGAGETTLSKLATAYSSLVNGGKKVEPVIIDRVQDRTGKTIYYGNNKVCVLCKKENFQGQLPPNITDDREEILDPITAYQITYMLKGVVDNGTGYKVRSLRRPMAGKTGTTNDSYDAWFLGFSPNLVAGVYIGMDIPEQMGSESGSSAASPIFTNFMSEALEGKPKFPFRIPKNVKLSPVNRKTGEPSYIGAEDVILEAFRPGTEPKVGALKSVIQIGADDQASGSTFDFDFTQETNQNGVKALEKVIDNIEADPEKVDEKLDDGLY